MKHFKVVYYIFGGFVALIALLLLLSTLPITGNYKIMIVQSGSMEPAIQTGSIVIVKPGTDYKIGDVITFGPVSKGKIPTTHRIADIRLQTGTPVYVTKGDANNAPDVNETQSKDVIGLVLFHVPFIGYVLAAAKKPIGFIILIAVPALIVIVDELKKIWVEVKKKSAKGTA